MGFADVFGIVATVGANPATSSAEVPGTIIHGKRWMEIQLVGEAYGNSGFQRGVSVFPTLNDEVHFVTDDDLMSIYGNTGPSMVTIGSQASSEGLPASVDIDRIVTRHAAILGSTGSGKSNTVAGLLKSITSGSYPNARVVVIDPHGEYGDALKETAVVFSLGDKQKPLIVPYWAMTFDELAWFLVDRRSSSETQQDMKLRDTILEHKKLQCQNLKSGAVSPEDIIADSPIPFNLRQIWYDLYTQEFATLNTNDDWNTIAYKKNDAGLCRGSAEKVIPPEFDAPGAGSSPPFKSKKQNNLGSYLNKIFARLRDKRFDFLLNPGSYDGVQKDLHDLVVDWMAHDRPITILDLSAIPSEVMDLIIGLVTRILFETMIWGRDLPGIGRQRPLLIVYEEAHLYLSKGQSQFVQGYASHAARRILKEGRKYGIGAVVVSQRPSELDETILSQCGTFFALRLSTSDDQGRVKSTVPDSLAGLIDLLPALRTGEAIILGEAVPIPVRVRVRLVEPRPSSSDPEPAKSWSSQRVDNAPYATAITRWRQQFESTPEKGGDSDGKNAS